MMHCWIPREDGYALMDESGSVVGHLIELDKQIYTMNQKLVYGPSRWFPERESKLLERRDSA